MFTLEQMFHTRESMGDPLPAVFESLDTAGTRFQRGELALVCAGPGVGKSAFILTYALRAGVPTFYFSADSNKLTQLSRSISILTGWDMEKSREIARSNDLNGATPYLRKTYIVFDDEANPELEHVWSKLKGYFEVFEDYPALIIIDNVTNVVTEASAEDPFAGLELLMEHLNKLARRTGACVVGLHHVLGAYNDGDKPIPLSGIKGQIARVPAMVLTLHKQFDQLRVSTVKNRGPGADASGMSWVPLAFDQEHMQIADLTQNGA